MKRPSLIHFAVIGGEIVAVIVALFCVVELCKRFIPPRLIWQAFPGDIDGDGYTDGTEVTMRGFKIFDRYNGHVPRLNLSAGGHPHKLEKYVYSGQQTCIFVDVTSDNGWFSGKRPIPVEFSAQDIDCLSSTPDGPKSKFARIGFEYLKSRFVSFMAPRGFVGDISIVAKVLERQSQCDSFTFHVVGTPSEFSAPVELRQLGRATNAWKIICDRPIDPTGRYVLEYAPGGPWELIGPLVVVDGALISETRYADLSDLEPYVAAQHFRVVRLQ